MSKSFPIFHLLCLFLKSERKSKIQTKVSVLANDHAALTTGLRVSSFNIRDFLASLNLPFIFASDTIK